MSVSCWLTLQLQNRFSAPMLPGPSFKVATRLVWARRIYLGPFRILLILLLLFPTQSKNRVNSVATGWTTARRSTTGPPSCSGAALRTWTRRRATTWARGASAAPSTCSATSCRWRTSPGACPTGGRPSPAYSKCGRAPETCTSTRSVGKYIEKLVQKKKKDKKNRQNTSAVDA